MNLTSAQQNAIDEMDRDLQIIACAGAGKTEVISRRIANIVCNNRALPSEIVAFTFTEKAARSLKTRISEKIAEKGEHDINISDMYIGTIHGFCRKILLESKLISEDCVVLDDVKQRLFIQRYKSKCGLTDIGLGKSYFDVSCFISCIDKMMLCYDDKGLWEEEIVQALDNYRKCLKENNFIDFASIIFDTVQASKSNTSVIDILKKVKYLIVDEYQDIDDLQETLISAIHSYGANICVVGDDDQTIYRFRGSNADNMINFQKRYPESRRIDLDKNFRCAPEIIDIAANVIKHNTNRVEKTMEASSKSKAGKAKLEAIGFENREDQYDYIVRKIIRENKLGTDFSDIAVLTRKGKFISELERALRRYNISYETNSAEYFFESDFYKKLKTILKFLSDNERYTEELKETWGVYKNYVRSKIILGRAIKGSLQSIVCEFIFNLDVVLTEDEQHILAGFIGMLEDFDTIFGDMELKYRANNLLYFLEHEAKSAYKYHNLIPISGEENSVKIMTIHKAKGLEFKTVFLIEMQDKDFPTGARSGKQWWKVLGDYFSSVKEKFESNIEDERKLMYVAITRAIQNLYFCYHLDERDISMFMYEVNESHYVSVDEDDLIPRDRTKKSISKKDGNYQDAYTERKYYYEMLKEARSKVLDYYGSGARACRNHAAWGEFDYWCNASDDEILAKAKKMGFI